ncbi:MAG: hypothetical protein ACFE9I_04035 [Candidatus Hermodarchaeota archaeon]
MSSINIELPESNWTITDIKVNISDIKLGSEIITIEDSETTFEIVWNKNVNFRTFALATQIEILEVTELFGVYIYARKSVQATQTIKFQLQGFDEGNNKPNGIILRSIDLNISNNLDWYYQDFSSDSIELTVGNYSLVMNGTNLIANPDATYNWQKDHLDPDIRNLHTSSYITSWNSGIVNTSFLCKLNQTVDRYYIPSDLNMSAEFDGKDYSIPDSGLLEVVNITYLSEETNMYIPITINKSVKLDFNFQYTLNLTNEFFTLSSGYIKEFNNQWSLSPLFHRISQIYFVKFRYPRNWYNFTVNRKVGSTWENVTSIIDIDLNNRIITFPNNTLVVGSDWRIIANSPKIEFTLNFPIVEWETKEDLQFSVILPFVDGTLTFDLINPTGFGFNEPIVKEVISLETYFNYTIPENALQGFYIAYIFWNNATDAGFNSQEFEVIKHKEPFNPIWIWVAVFSTIGASVLIYFSYITIKRYNIRRTERAEKLKNKCMDALSLEHIIVSEKKSGLNLYQQRFAEREIDASMISGFLQAIHSFGIELMKIEDRSQTIKLEYKGSIILMSEFVNLRLILVMKESPSRNFLYSVEDLAFDIYRQYGKIIDEFNGDIKPYRGIEDLLKSHLYTSFVYPFEIAKIDKLEKIRISQSERLFINKAVSLMKQNNKDHFYIRSFFPENTCSPKDIEIIQGLINKKIFQVLTPKSQKFK